jgi:hypothetical protein
MGNSNRAVKAAGANGVSKSASRPRGPMSRGIDQAEADRHDARGAPFTAIDWRQGDVARSHELGVLLVVRAEASAAAGSTPPDDVASGGERLGVMRWSGAGNVRRHAELARDVGTRIRCDMAAVRENRLWQGGV